MVNHRFLSENVVTKAPGIPNSAFETVKLGITWHPAYNSGNFADSSSPNKKWCLDVVFFSVCWVQFMVLFVVLGRFCCCCCCMLFRCYFERKPKSGKFGCNQKIEAAKRKLLFFWGARKRKKRLHKYSHELCFWIAFWKGVSRFLNRKVGVSNKRFLGSANVRPFVQLQPFRNTRKSEKRREKNTTCEESKEITKIDIDIWAIWGRAYLAIIQLPVFEAENGIFNFSTIKNLNPPFFRDFTDQMLLTQNHHHIPYTVYLQNNIILLSESGGGTWQSSYRKIHDYQKSDDWLDWQGKNGQGLPYLLQLTSNNSRQLSVPNWRTKPNNIGTKPQKLYTPRSLTTIAPESPWCLEDYFLFLLGW